MYIESELSIKEQENWITRLNYDPVAKLLLFNTVLMSMAFLAHAVETDPSTPRTNILPGHITDFLDSSALTCLIGSLAREVKEDDSITALPIAIGTLLPSINEYLQKAGVVNGFYDPKDYLAFLAGSVFWALFDKSAKALYDSGATKPIYKMLGIQDRRLKQLSVN